MKGSDSTRQGAQQVRGVDAQPLVTVGIPTFNRAEWLARSVTDALAQTYAHFEVVVSNNASTDNTRDVLNAISNPRLRVLHQAKNIGLSPNWNACLADAKGEYIVIASDDDRIQPTLLERAVELIGRDPSVNLVVALGDVYLADEDRLIPARASKRFSTGVWDGLDILVEFLEGNISLHDCTTIIRTEVLRARGGYRDGWPHAADLAAWLPLMLKGRVGLVNEPCGTYCAHALTQTAALSTAARLTDLEKLMALLIDGAEEFDKPRRERVRLHSKRYISRHAIGYIVADRRSGRTLGQTLSLMWAWRDRIGGLGVMRLLGSPRDQAILFLPHAVTHWLRRARRRPRNA